MRHTFVQSTDPQRRKCARCGELPEQHLRREGQKVNETTVLECRPEAVRAVIESGKTYSVPVRPAAE